MFLKYIIFIIFAHLLINYVIFTLRNVKFNLTQNIQITQSHYVKLTLGYVQNSTQKF